MFILLLQCPYGILFIQGNTNYQPFFSYSLYLFEQITWWKQFFLSLLQFKRTKVIFCVSKELRQQSKS